MKEMEGNVPIKHNIYRGRRHPLFGTVVSEVPKLILKTPLVTLDGISALSKITEQDFEYRKRGRTDVPTFYSGRGPARQHLLPAHHSWRIWRCEAILSNSPHRVVI